MDLVDIAMLVLGMMILLCGGMIIFINAAKAKPQQRWVPGQMLDPNTIEMKEEDNDNTSQ